jgi:hypothetical protein
VNDQLSWRRLLRVLRADVMRNHRAWLVALGTAALVALFLSVLGAMDSNVGNGFYGAFFIASLFSLGTLATSQSFVDLHGRTTNTAFLLLPASALEKTLARLLLTTVGLFAGLLVLTTVLSWLLEGINTVMFDVRRETFVPFDRLAWLMLPHYLVAQSLFFLGAAWFRKVHYVKTVGAVLLIVLGLCMIAIALGWMVGPTVCRNADCLAFPFVDWLADAAPLVYVYVLPPFCWFVAWLRVTEAQVSHGI